MAIGRKISLTPIVKSKKINVTATAGQTLFTVTGGYRVNNISVYRNGVLLAVGYQGSQQQYFQQLHFQIQQCSEKYDRTLTKYV